MIVLIIIGFVLWFVGIMTILVADSDEFKGAGVIFLWLGTFLMLVSVAENKYKQGQTDSLKGKIVYEAKVSTDTTYIKIK